MVNIIPMAGEGSRFSKGGYTLPKALIPVSGIPMVIKAIRSMPKSDKWIFIVRKEHIDDYKIDILIKNEIKDAIIISVDKTTEGQACTCMLAKPYLNPEEPLFIAACDNAFVYDNKKYEKLTKDNTVDSIVWTFTKTESLRQRPKSWGWCVINKDGLTIDDMSVKVPISDNPYEDHAVVATFYFKKAQNFIEAVDLMIKENYRINNEFYVDAVPIFLKKIGQRSVIFDVDLYIGWGTPDDLYSYQRIEYFVNNAIKPIGISKEDECKFTLWKRYIKND